MKVTKCIYCKKKMYGVGTLYGTYPRNLQVCEICKIKKGKY